MTTHSQLNGSGVALRVLAVSLACATLFLLDRIIPPLLGSEPSPFQDATLYLWLLILPVFGYSWILLRSRWLGSAGSCKRWLFAVCIALPLSLAFAFVTLALFWIS